MRNRRVLITGGAGHVGSHIVDHLILAGAGPVVVFDNLARGRAANLEWARECGLVIMVDGDVRDRAAVAEAMRGVDVVFHQAALRVTQCAEEPRLALEVMVDGTFNVAEAAVSAGVRKVIAASSAVVYGAAAEFPTPESHPPYSNRTLYGAAKVFNEGLLRAFHEMHQLDYVILRYFNIYGPRMDMYGAHLEVIVRWMERIAAGQPPMIFGDGTETMDFVYVSDVARANLLAAESDATDEVFNVGSGRETSLKELAQALLHVMGSNLRPVYAPPRAVNPVPRRLADTTRAWERLSFRTEVDLEQGLRQTVEWWTQSRLQPT